MEYKNKPQQVIFTVNKDLKPSDPTVLNRQSAEKSLKNRAEKVQAWSSDNPFTLLQYSDGHGLLNTVHLAYDQHYNLELSPDDLWLAILQGFSNHLELNHQKLRKQFVNFDGKKELTIIRDGFTWGSNKNDWAGCFVEWGEQIQENIGKQNYDNLIPNFSTQTQTSSACFKATLMDSMKHYFDYRCLTRCGIPQVKLTGTLEDWQQLKERTQNLGQYNLEWWTSVLIPILDKIIESYQGKIDEIFWNCIYKIVPKGRYSGSVTTLTGWILNFFPYVNDYNGKTQNKNLKSLKDIYENYETLKKQSTGFKQPIGILNQSSVFGGMVQTPFIWEYLGQNKEMNIVAGFHNICFDGQFLKPAKGWAIAEQVTEPDVKKKQKR